MLTETDGGEPAGHAPSTSATASGTCRPSIRSTASSRICFTAARRAAAAGHLLPGRDGHARADGRLPPEGKVRLEPRSSARDRNGFRRRARRPRSPPTGSRSSQPGDHGRLRQRNYCPGQSGHARADGRIPPEVRAQRAVRPPNCTGIFDDVPCPSQFATGSSSSRPRASRPDAAAATSVRTIRTSEARWPCSWSRSSGWSSTRRPDVDTFGMMTFGLSSAHI